VIDLAPLMRLGILVVRPGMLVAMSPAFGGAFAPARVKVGLIVLIAIALAPSAAVPLSIDPLPIALVLAREAAIGFALALALQVLIAGAGAAGSLIGIQMHLSYGATIDPQSGVRNPVLSVLYSNIALVTFFSIDGHHAFLRALRQSYVDLPVGAGHIGASLPGDVARLLGFVFTLGLRLAAPVVIVLLLVETALALLTRSAPALNSIGVGAPVRIVVGFLVLAVVVPTVVGLVAGTSSSIVQMAAHAARAFR
jgi:flagellar biosynthetic protein FliR